MGVITNIKHEFWNINKNLYNLLKYSYECYGPLFFQRAPHGVGGGGHPGGGVGRPGPTRGPAHGYGEGRGQYYAPKGKLFFCYFHMVTSSLHPTVSHHHHKLVL